MTPADGDDYTYDNLSAAAVFNRPLDDIEYSAAVWMSQVRLLAARDFHRRNTPHGPPDLRTADQVGRDDVAALGNEIDTLRRKLYDQAGRLDRRIDALEAAVAKLGVQP